MKRLLLALVIGWLVITHKLDAGPNTELFAAVIISILALPSARSLLD